MRSEVTNLDRLEQFEYYNKNINPFVIVNTKIDITNLYNKTKKYYPTIGYALCLAVNKVDNFKYRYEDGKIYYYDVIDTSYTEPFDDGNVGFFHVDFKDSYKEYLSDYNRIKSEFKEKKKILCVKIMELYGFHVFLGFRLMQLLQHSIEKFLFHNLFGINLVLKEIKYIQI